MKVYFYVGIITFLRARMANIPASVHTLRISAPRGKDQAEKSGGDGISSDTEKSGEEMG